MNDQQQNQCLNQLESNNSQRAMSRNSACSQNSIGPSARIRKFASLKKKKSQTTQYTSLQPTNHKNFSPEVLYKRLDYSPNRKQVYWQNWLLPTSMSQSCIQMPLSITAKSYCALISDTNQIIVSGNMNQKMQVASLTKIMTAYTVLCICHANGLKIFQHSITIHQQAAWIQGTSAGLKIGQQVLVIDLLYGLLLPSGNDAAIALAQYFGKFLSFKLVRDNQKLMSKTSVDKFNVHKNFYDTQYQKDSIKLFSFQMNKNASKIGLKNTYFANPTGLGNTKSHSTAKDLALLTSHCLKNHILRTIFKKKIYQCQVKNQKLASSRQIQWKNTNRHLFQLRQCIGVKTGITPNAGPCLSAAYKALGKQIVVIVLNCSSTDDRYNDAQSLFKFVRKKIRVF